MKPFSWEKEDCNRIAGKKRPSSVFKLLLSIYIYNALKRNSNCIFIVIDKIKIKNKANVTN